MSAQLKDAQHSLDLIVNEQGDCLRGTSPEPEHREGGINGKQETQVGGRAGHSDWPALRIKRPLRPAVP